MGRVDEAGIRAGNEVHCSPIEMDMEKACGAAAPRMPAPSPIEAMFRQLPQCRADIERFRPVMPQRAIEQR